MYVHGKYIQYFPTINLVKNIIFANYMCCVIKKTYCIIYTRIIITYFMLYSNNTVISVIALNSN